jgi:hypothetical protein
MATTTAARDAIRARAVAAGKKPTTAGINATFAKNQKATAATGPGAGLPPGTDRTKAVADESEFGWGNTTISREQVMSRLHAQAHGVALARKKKRLAAAATTAAATASVTPAGQTRTARHSHHGKPA